MLCVPPSRCRAHCDATAGCAGVRVSGFFCELLASVTLHAEAFPDRWRVYARAVGTACTHSQDFAAHVGTLVVTALAETGWRYVLAPEEDGSVEVYGAFGGVETWTRDRIMVIDACGTCGVTPASDSASVGSGWQHTPPLEDADDPLPAGWWDLPATEALCTVDPACRPKLQSCRAACGLPPPCEDMRADLIGNVGIDLAHWAAQGGCAGAVRGTEDQDGHSCRDTLAELQVLDGADQTATLCDVCCGTCEEDGQTCPEDPWPSGAEVCVERCAKGHLPPIPAFGRRRRGSSSSVLRFSPVTVSRGGRYKICFCDSTLGNCARPKDFSIEVGTLHCSGVSCLLEAGLRDQTCAPQDEGGLACSES